MISNKGDQIVETDIVIVGGGLGGSVAAIKAAEQGVKVAILEQAVLRSASGAVTGLHRTLCIHPDYNVSFEEFAKSNFEIGGGIINEDLSYAIAQDSLDRVLDLETWGIKVRGCDGKFDFADAAGISPIPNIVIKINEGPTLMPKLAEQVKKRNIKVFERTIATGILTKNGEIGGEVVGATAMNTRSGQFIVFKAKAVILCTGGSYRIYRSRNGAYAPDRLRKTIATKTGDGEAMAYRVGAEAVNMEFFQTTPRGMKDWDFHGAGFLIHWTKTQPFDGLGNLLPARESTFEEVKLELAEGRGPVFYDLRNTSEELKEKIDNAFKTEGEFMVKLFMGSRPVKPWEELLEFAASLSVTTLHGNVCGILTDTHARTNIKGLYVAGDSQGGGQRFSSMGAFAFGARAGKHAAAYVLRLEDSDVDPAQLEAEKSRVYRPMKQKEGYEWFELEDKVGSIIMDYSGFMRNEKKLERGLERLNHIKTEYLPRLIAGSPRDLMRALEVKSMFTIGEMHMRAALFRKESRILPDHFHYRVDYPETDNKYWKKQTVVRKVNDQMTLSLREPNRMCDRKGKPPCL